MPSTRYSHEELHAMDDEALIQAQIEGFITKEERLGVMTQRSQMKYAGQSLVATICRSPDDAHPELPSRVRVWGDAIDCPTFPKRDDETQEEHFNRLPVVTGHLGPLLALLTYARIPFLRAIREALKEPKIANFPSQWSGGVYARVVSQLEQSPSHVQLKRDPDMMAAEILLQWVDNALPTSTDEPQLYPATTCRIKDNNLSYTPSSDDSF